MSKKNILFTMIALSIFFSWLLFENWGLWKCVCNKERWNRTGMKPFWAKLCSKLHVHHVTHCLQEIGFINVSEDCYVVNALCNNVIILQLCQVTVKEEEGNNNSVTFQRLQTMLLEEFGMHGFHYEVLISVTLELCKVEEKYFTSELHVWIWSNLNHRN